MAQTVNALVVANQALIAARRVVAQKVALQVPPQVVVILQKDVRQELVSAHQDHVWELVSSVASREDAAHHLSRANVIVVANAVRNASQERIAALRWDAAKLLPEIRVTLE